MGTAIAEANRALDQGENGDGMTADELEVAADELKKTVESVVSAGLAKLHPLAIEASKSDKSFREKAAQIKVSGVHVV